MQLQDELRAVDGRAASAHPPERRDAGAHVALLAATALGFAYAPIANSEAHVCRLADLAGDHPETLMQAQTAALGLDVGPTWARMNAATLLRRASQHVIGPDSEHLADGGRAETMEGRP